jgi:D-alanyl-D-alanine dipeptidase
LRGVLAGFLTAVVLALRNYLKRKAAGKAELVTRAELCAEMREISERIHADHLALLEKLDSNHRELLAALERQAGRISALECGLARVDERTKE